MFNFLAYQTTVRLKQNRKREKEGIGGEGHRERYFKYSHESQHNQITCLNYTNTVITVTLEIMEQQ